MIIQLSHNGKELNITPKSKKNGQAYLFDTPNTGYRNWNNEPEHKRKFIKQQGLYLSNVGETFRIIPQQGELYFWGEWEPESNFHLTGNSFNNDEGLPHAIHTPLFPEVTMKKHNTDPFVFGEHFYYTNCKQKEKGLGNRLLHLEHGSIILFGSEINKSQFILDTVFVVDTKEPFDNDCKKNATHYPEALRIATLNLLEADWHQLYTGKMFVQKPNQSPDDVAPFSFFPCKVNCGANGFARPIIDWQRFNLKKPGAGTVLYAVNYSSDSDFWQDLVAELIRQGYSLGIKADLPTP